MKNERLTRDSFLFILRGVTSGQAGIRLDPSKKRQRILLVINRYNYYAYRRLFGTY